MTEGVFCTVLASVAVFGQTPSARPEFEVASVKASAPDAPEQVRVGVRIDGAQVHIAYFSLKDYIRIAYRVKDYQVSGPEWLATERFDIDAKLPAGAAREQVPEMLQALLEDRFAVKVHRESKEFPVYGLLVGSGGAKVKESPVDADASGGAVEVTASGNRDGVSIDFGKGSYFSLLPDRLEARKMTMANFADTLARFVDQPVVDMTELKGNYGVTLAISPEDYRVMLIQSAVNSGVTLPPQALLALQGATNDSVLVALRALGLRLEPRKAPLDVVVVDHALKAPAAN
ncbi:MAG: TIGR03435 family protein [Bryobacteraceae bacterium]